jgi:hypothetical protein
MKLLRSDERLQALVYRVWAFLSTLILARKTCGNQARAATLGDTNF